MLCAALCLAALADPGCSLLHLPQQGSTRGRTPKHSRVWGTAFLCLCPRATLVLGSARPGCFEDTLWLPALCLKLYSRS